VVTAESGVGSERNNTTLLAVECGRKPQAAEIEWCMATAPKAAAKNMAATDATRHANLGLLPFASEESAPIETEIIFRDLQSHLISVPVRGESLFEPGRAPRFAWRQSLASSRFTDLTRDGKRILVGLPQENANTPLILLLNWTETLRR
jgi:hypothetical protein